MLDSLLLEAKNLGLPKRKRKLLGACGMEVYITSIAQRFEEFFGAGGEGRFLAREDEGFVHHIDGSMAEVFKAMEEVDRLAALTLMKDAQKGHEVSSGEGTAPKGPPKGGNEEEEKSPKGDGGGSPGRKDRKTSAKGSSSPKRAADPATQAAFQRTRDALFQEIANPGIAHVLHELAQTRTSLKRPTSPDKLAEGESRAERKKRKKLSKWAKDNGAAEADGGIMALNSLSSSSSSSEGGGGTVGEVEMNSPGGGDEDAEMAEASLPGMATNGMELELRLRTVIEQNLNRLTEDERAVCHAIWGVGLGGGTGLWGK